MLRAIGLSIAVVGLSVACGSSKDDSGGKKAPPPEPAKPASDAAPPPEPTVPALAREDVQALVDAWLAAQNAGDFEAYQGLYAARFTGVKRVGAKTFNFDREGWLKDRERMFKKKVIVEAADTKIASTPRMAVASFTQTWSSGTFKDVGPKQLVIVQDGGLRIAREEMLSSTVTGAAEAAEPLAREQFSFVFQSGKTPRVVLRTDVDRDWGKGELRLLSRDTTAAVAKTADLAKVDDAFEDWLGKEVVLYEMDGSDCFGKVAELEVVTGFEPHFGTLQEWEESKASDRRVAKEIWNMGGEAMWLTARVDGCDAGGPWVWGHRQSGVSPEVLSVAKDPDLTAVAIARFRKLKGYKAVQKDFTAETGKKTAWDEEGLGPKVTVFHALDDSDWVAVSAVGGAGCGEWSGEYWAIFSVKGKNLVLLTDELNPGPLFAPQQAFDRDNTGEVYFIDNGRIVREVGTTYRLTEEVRLPIYDTPC